MDVTSSSAGNAILLPFIFLGGKKRINMRVECRFFFFFFVRLNELCWTEWKSSISSNK